MVYTACKDRNKGFTLIELSISIVIIGLIVAGIVAGGDLIRMAYMNSILTDVAKYEVATKTFRLKYDAIPADFSDAVSYWGGSVDNGNANRTIDSTEREDFWEHLVKAGLISGDYDGSDVARIGLNYPESSIDNVGFYAIYAEVFQRWANMIHIGAHVANDNPWGGAFTPTEALGLDKKFDDGDEDNGRMALLNGSDYSNGDCVTGNFWEPTGTIDLTKTLKSCVLRISGTIDNKLN